MTTNEGRDTAEEAVRDGETHAGILGAVFKALHLRDGDLLIVDTERLTEAEHERFAHGFRELAKRGDYPKVSAIINDRGWDISALSGEEKRRLLEELVAELKR